MISSFVWAFSIAVLSLVTPLSHSETTAARCSFAAGSSGFKATVLAAAITCGRRSSRNFCASLTALAASGSLALLITSSESRLHQSKRKKEKGEKYQSLSHRN